MVTVEILGCTLGDLQRAYTGGAHRIELCAASEVGGLTPSLALIESVLEANLLPAAIMVRPRAGDFCYSRDDQLVMERDIRRIAALRPEAIVTGANLESGELDAEAWRRWLDAAGGVPLVCHRSFDQGENLLRSAELLARLGVRRILTSGGRASAESGLGMIRMLVEMGGIQILAGGAVRPRNAARVVQGTGVTQIHASAYPEPPAESSMFGAHRAVDPDRVAALVAAVN